MLSKQTTNKLFYGKWPYKVTCQISGAHLIRRYGHLANKSPQLFRGPAIDENKLIKFITDSKDFFDNKDIKKRIQYDEIDFYLYSKEEFTNLQTTLKKYVIRISQPVNNDQLKTLLENKKYTLCDKLPHGKYRYKITFKDMPVKVRNDLIVWAEKYDNEDIYITKSTRTHFKSEKHRYGTHYFYVKDSKMIMLIAMAAGGYIRRTDEYVVRNSINTESNQELLCQP